MVNATPADAGASGQRRLGSREQSSGEPLAIPIGQPRRPGTRPLVGIGLVAIGAASAAAGLAFHSVFGYQPLLKPICVAAGLPVLLTIALGLIRRFSFAVSQVFSAGAWLAAACLTLEPVPHSGPLASRALTGVAGGVLNSWAQLLNTTMPVPARPALLVLPFTLTWLSASIGTELVLRARTALVPVAPALLVLTIATSLSRPLGQSNLPQAGAVTVAAAVLAIVRNFQTARASDVIVRSAGRRPRQQDRETGALPMGVRLADPSSAFAAIVLVIASTVAAIAISPFSLFDRSPVNPRRYWPIPLQPVALMNPLDQVTGWLVRPRQVLFQIRSSGATDLQLAVLDTFNGQRWTSSSRFTPVGLVLPPLPTTGSARTVTSHFQLGRLGGRLLPAASRPVTITGFQGVSADTDTGMLLSDEPLHSGMSYSLVSNLGPVLGPGQLARLSAARGPGTIRDLELPRGLPTVIYRLARNAMETGPATTAFQRATLLERYMRDEFSNDPRVPSGNTDGDLRRFLTTRVGTCVQFASAFTLAARILGIPSRIVTGFAAESASSGAGIRKVRAGDALAWSEAEFTGIGWVPFFPTPPSASSRRLRPQEPALGETGAQARVRARVLRIKPEQLRPAASPGRRPTSPGGRTTVHVPDHSDELTWIWCAAGAGVLCYLIVVLLARPIRRHRRTLGTARDRIVGAWLDLLDQFAEINVSLAPGASNSAIAMVGARAAGKDLIPELSSLAVLVNRALFAAAELNDRQAVRAWRYRDVSGSLIRQATPMHKRLRARLIMLARMRRPATVDRQHRSTR